jgi:hypothetical protein
VAISAARSARMIATSGRAGDRRERYGPEVAIFEAF